MTEARKTDKKQLSKPTLSPTKVGKGKRKERTQKRLGVQSKTG